MRRNSIFKKTENQNRGTTMLETLVAFSVLMVILGVLYNIIAFCSVLRMQSADTNTSMQIFNREIYNSKSVDSSITEESEDKKPRIISADDSKVVITRYRTYDDTPLFYLSLSNESGEKVEGAAPLSLYNLDAVTYSYKGNAAEEEDEEDVENADVKYGTAVPKALQFEWNGK